jgi:dTDP-4-dehydrorhamnose 3,5-epimerase
MHITESRLRGAFIIDIERREDERGYFGRTFCREEFERAGLTAAIEQCSTSFNTRRGTLRGMHFQREPSAEHKLVRCTRGHIYDVIVDLRPNSPTRYEWTAVELSDDNGQALYIPSGFAHGFQTLVDGTEVFYQISVPYRADLASGVRWDDPCLGIEWPLPNPILSERDRSFPDLVTPAVPQRCRSRAPRGERIP